MAKLLVPFDEHYSGHVTFKGGLVKKKIQNTFRKYGFMEKIKESTFKLFFIAPELQFYGSLIN